MLTSFLYEKNSSISNITGARDYLSCQSLLGLANISTIMQRTNFGKYRFVFGLTALGASHKACSAKPRW